MKSNLLSYDQTLCLLSLPDSWGFLLAFNSVFYQVHRKICKRLETKKEYNGSRRVFFQIDANQNSEVHREDTCVWEKHNISYVWFAADKRVEVFFKGKPMIEHKDGKA